MSYKINEIVKANSTSEFRNDVQLSEYRSNNNIKLLEGYIFTKKAVKQKKSSIDILRHLCEAYTPGNNPNRFAIIATYGHGKSHLALSLANYFGKPSDSAESKTIMKNVEHAVNDAALYGYFKDFKHAKKPCIVLIMSGTDQRDLPTQFYNAVETALKTDNESVDLPFWYKGAERYLESINQNGVKEKANQFLSEKGLDLEVLLERVKKQDSSTYDVCYNLCLELNGIAPNFGSAVNLKEAVAWLSVNLCGVDKPYSGVLILFDEFSAFVRDYALSMSSRPGTPLQDLLDGVDSCKEKVSFAAFSQHDPESVVRNVLHDTTSLQSMLIQLNRIPKTEKYFLHSCLEEVLDAYLRQDNDKWVTLCSNSFFSNELYEANDVAVEVFKKRYEDELDWSDEHFQDVVTKGCFPLHPMTTALLASVEFQETTNPRSVLGFVLKSLDEIKNQSALNNNMPAWILSISLVEHFKEMFGAEIWKDYIDAKSQAGGVDAKDSEIAVLKGMVLQKAVDVPTKSMGFERVIGQFAGISKPDATVALQQLAERSVIRYDATQKLYMFWPAGRGANKVEELLVHKVASIKSLDQKIISEVEKVLRGAPIPLISPKPIRVSWGQSDDWQAEEMLASREMLTIDWINKLVAERLTQKLLVGDDTKVRGLVVWLIASEESDVTWFREELPTLLGQVFPASTIPLIFKRPNKFIAELPPLLRRTFALTKFSQSELKDTGTEQYEAVVTQNNSNLKSTIDAFRSNCMTETLPAFRARIQAVQPRSLEDLFVEIYKMAFPNNPQKWFTQYKVNQSALKSATKLLIGHLLNSTLDLPQILDAASYKVAKDAVNLFLKAEWRIVDSSYRIKEPLEGSKIYPAWNLLDNYFSATAGQKSVKIIIDQLLNVPYGYDINTVSIVFSAWCGFNRHELEMHDNSRPVTIANLKLDVKDFIKHLGELQIKRRNPDELKGKVNDILRVLQSGKYDMDGARKAIHTLNEYIASNNAEDKQTATEAHSSLTMALEKAINYDKHVDAIYSTLNKSNTFSDLFSSLHSLKQLSFSSKVTPINKGLSEVKSDILGRIETAIISKCDSLHSISSIADYGLRYKQLSDLKTQLNKHDLTNLTSKIDSAISNLNTCKQQLESQENDRESVGYLNGLATTGNLALLRSSLEKLLNMDLSSDSAKTKLLDKSKAISKEIERISSLLLSLCNRFEKAANAKEIKALLADLNRMQPLLEKTDEYTISTALIGRCSKVDEFFDIFYETQRDDPRTPSQVESTITSLNELQNKFKVFLGPELIVIVPNAISKIEASVLAKQKDALKWLEIQEHELNVKRRPDSVLDALKKQPYFIPSEASARLISLKKAALQMMDDDQVLHVYSLFTKISDPNKRQECLKQLQSFSISEQQ
ncbi:MAG: hypothetical protein JZU65_08175 [Chlorobium sp.]|nr:hypothetical protein [Chlorobium sp.]